MCILMRGIFYIRSVRAIPHFAGAAFSATGSLFNFHLIKTIKTLDPMHIHFGCEAGVIAHIIMDATIAAGLPLAIQPGCVDYFLFRFLAKQFAVTQCLLC